MIAASAKAATNPSHGQRGCNERATANSATHRISAAVAMNLVRRSAASFATSSGSAAKRVSKAELASDGMETPFAGGFGGHLNDRIRHQRMCARASGFARRVPAAFHATVFILQRQWLR